MAKRLEIAFKPGMSDPQGRALAGKARRYLGLEIDKARLIRVLTMDLKLTEEEFETARTRIFTNPVTQVSSFSPLAQDFDFLLWVGYRPGVRDNPGATALEAIGDFFGRAPAPDEAVYTSEIYEIGASSLSRTDVELIASELVANDIIQQWRVITREEWDEKEGIGLILPRVMLKHTPTLTEISVASDEELMAVSQARSLALNPADAPVIREYFTRPEVLAQRAEVGLEKPTDVELEYIAQARSDHCNHNTFGGLFHYRDLATGEERTVDNLFKTCISTPTRKLAEEKDWVASVLWDNAGVGRFDENHYYTITGETHNSPSNMEAYGGSLTGIVGVYRDPMGTGLGSKLVMGAYGYCVGPRDYNGALKPRLHPRRLLDGVIEGVKDGGNKSGIPTPFGQVFFHDCYLGKCLVFVTALGLMPTTVQGRPSEEKTTSPGELIVMCGGRVGADGIHGVTASSEVYSEHTPAGHVQIGDPYTQKKMHDFLLAARDEGLIQFITDNGGGGLSSSVGESAMLAGGAVVDLDQVPLKYEGLDQWEIWISESQERMTVSIRPEDLARFMELSALNGVESTVIGEYTNSGKLHLKYKGRTVAYVDLALLESDFPQWVFEAEWTPPNLRGLTEPALKPPTGFKAALLDLLSRPNIASKEWINRQYDHEVQGGSIIKPLIGVKQDIPSDAAVTCPVLGSKSALVFTQTINPTVAAIDAYDMTTLVIDEAVRRILAVGGRLDHIGGVDNFCWPSIQHHEADNPDAKFKAAQLVRSNWALKDTILAYSIPLLSGKDSMYVDGYLTGPYGERHRVSALPTLQFSAVSVTDDFGKCVSLDFKAAGDLIYLLGTTRDELGGSEYYAMLGYTGANAPKTKLAENLALYRKFEAAVQSGLVASAKAVARGGLGAALALGALAGGLGAKIDLDAAPTGQPLSTERVLFSESTGRLLVSVRACDQARFERAMRGAALGMLGRVSEGGALTLTRAGQGVARAPLTELEAAFKKPFGDLT